MNDPINFIDPSGLFGVWGSIGEKAKILRIRIYL